MLTKDASIQVVGISYDTRKVLADFAKKRSIKFPLLADEDSKLIDAFKIRNKSAGRRVEFMDGIPHPVTFLVDKEGIVRAKLIGTTRKRHKPQEIVAIAEKAAKSAVAN